MNITTKIILNYLADDGETIFFQSVMTISTPIANKASIPPFKEGQKIRIWKDYADLAKPGKSYEEQGFLKTFIIKKIDYDIDFIGNEFQTIKTNLYLISKK